MIYTRWVVAYKHDSSPVDECLYVHKSKAENKRLSLKNKDKLKINEIAIMPKELAKHLSAKLSEL
jgi:hypothetical protein